jgi:formiminotetrahydrofolate cyclodeaminase
MFTNKSVREYIEKMAGTTFPSPKGGSALAITGAMGAALIKMCCQVSAKRNPGGPGETRYGELREQAEALMNRFLFLADRDTEVVEEMIRALRLAKGKTPEQCRTLQESYQAAAQALVDIKDHLLDLIGLAEDLRPLCATSCLIDLYIVQSLAQAAMESTSESVRDNNLMPQNSGCPLTT